MVVVSPKHIVFGGPTLAAGKGFTVTRTESVLSHPVIVSVSVKKYFVVTAGLAQG